MRRFTILLGVLLLGVVIGSARGSLRGREGACEGFTPARMLQDPELARQYFAALHGGDRSALEQFDAMIGELRAAHGCGELTAERVPVSPAVPPAPRLPPGHPPIGGTVPAPVFQAEPGSTLTI